MDFNGFQWISMDFNGFRAPDHLAGRSPPRIKGLGGGAGVGFQWISMDFNRFQWISMDFNGFQWISMDFNGKLNSAKVQR